MIKEFCDFNQIKIEDYIVQCVEDDYFTRKYGDLNEKINPSKSKVEENSSMNEVKEEDKNVEKKKVGRPRKKKDDNASTLNKEKKEEVIINNKETEIEQQPKKVKRILKVR